MQSKRYDSIERQVLPATTGVDSRVIENNENHQVNYHGVRFKGRIIANVDSAGANYGSGYITLMCLPNDFITIPTIRSDNDMLDAQSMIIAVEPWMTVVGVTNNINSYLSGYDFDIVLKTSRNCATGGKIIGQVTNESGLTCTITTLLSMFETTA